MGLLLNQFDQDAKTITFCFKPGFCFILKVKVLHFKYYMCTMYGCKSLLVNLVRAGVAFKIQ